MKSAFEVRPTGLGRVVGLGLGKFRYVGSGVGLMLGACLCLGTLSSSVLAGPEGANVAHGNVTITHHGNRTIIRASDGSIINYSSFNLSSYEHVRFIQPNSSSRVLNRISGSAPTTIDGSVRSNGIVYFANRAGVIFGPNAVLNVGGIYAAAANISNTDFMNGLDRFTDARGAVVNEGRIESNFAALVGDRVSNSGYIDAHGGVITMVAGNEVTLTPRGDTMSVKIDASSDAGRGIRGSGPGVENTGTLKSDGGKAFMVAGDMYSLAVRNTGTVQARDIKVEGQGRGRVEVSGTLDASNQVGGNKGGTIQVTGERVDLIGANLDASGRNGGGEILVGGDYQGKGTLRNAENTRVDANSRINADATESGNGGKAVVWSDNTTSFAGNISANGGANSGDGGFIETSGKINLDIRGAVVNARSVSGTGKAGLWLMDPVNVTIDDPTGGDDTTGGVFTGSGTTTFDPDNSASPAIVDVNTINAALNAGTNVTITTGSVGTDAGNITVNAAVSKTMGTDATFTLLAANNINVTSSITSTTGALNLSFQAGGNVAIDAVIGTNGGSFSSSGVNFTQGASGSIGTLGGNVLINHTGNVSLGAVVNTGGGGFTSSGVNFTQGASGSIDTGGGNVQINHTGNVSLGAVLSTGGGTFSSSGVNYSQGASCTLSTSGGSVGIAHTGTVSVDGAINVGGMGSISIVGSTFAASATLTSGSGGISLHPANPLTDIHINDVAGGFNLSAATLANLAMPMGAPLTIGASGNGATILIGSAGNIDLSALNASMTLNGAIIRFNGALAFGSSGSLIINTTEVQDNHAGTDLTGGILSLFVTTGLGTGSASLGTNIDNLGAANVAGNLTIDNATNLSVGAVTVGGNLDLRSTGTLSSSGDLHITGTSLFVSRLNGGAFIHVGSSMSTFGGAVTLRSRNTANTADDAGPITLISGSGLSLAAVATTGALDVTSAGDIDATTGIVKCGAASFTAGGLTFGNITASQLQASGLITVHNTAGGAVSLTNSTFITLTSGSVIGGNLSLTATTGNIDVQTSSVAGSLVTLTTLASGATITTANLTGAHTFNLATTGPGADASIASSGSMTVAANLGGTLTFTCGGDATITSTPALTLGASSAFGQISVTAPDVTISGMIVSGGDITLQPDADGKTIGINSAGSDFSLSLAELLNLSALGTVTIGRINGTGMTTLGGLGAVDLSTTNYDLTLRGGQASFSDTLTLADDHLLTLHTAGVVSPNAGIDVVIGGTNGRVLIESTAAVDLTTSVDKIAGATTGGAITIVNSGAALEIGTIGMVSGLTGASGQNVSVTTDGDLTVNSAVATTGAGAVSLTSTTGSVIFLTGATASSGMTGSVTVLADNSIVSPADLTAIITAGTASLTATTGDIGTGNPMLIDVSALSGSVGGNATITNLGTGTLDAQFMGSATSTLTFTHAGLFSVASGNSISAERINLNIGDLALDGNLVGGNTITIANFASGAIGVGDAMVGMGDLSISKADLSHISTATLNIGSALTTGITVDNVAEADVATIGSVYLLALADGADITFSGSASTLHDLTARADDSINVNVNLVSSLGGLSLVADADAANDTDGDKINIANNVTISTSSPMGGAIVLTATGGIAGAGSLTLDSNQALTVNNAITAVGSLTLLAKGGITLNGAGSGNLVTITANGGVTISDDLTSTGAGLLINADADADGSGVFTLAAGKSIVTGGGNLSIVCSDITLDGTINAGSATVAISPAIAKTIGLGTYAGDIQISGTELSHITCGTLSLGSELTTLIGIDTVAAGDTANIANLINLLANDIDITGQFNTSSASLAFARGFAGNINLGMTSVMDQMNLSNAELAFITTNNLQFGGAATTNIFVNGVTSPDTANVAGTVTLLANGTISFINNASTFKTLSASAGNGIHINRDLTTTVGDLTLDGNANTTIEGDDAITIASGRTVNSAGAMTLRSTGGGIVGNGSLTLLANNGITLSNDLTTSGTTTIDADHDADNMGTLLVSSGRVISTSGNDLHISAADLTLDGSIAANQGAVFITRSGSGTIGLGVASGDMMLSGVEMGRIIATGLTIGGSTISDMTIDGVTATNSNGIAGLTTLIAGSGTMTFSGTASVFNNLDARASGGMTISAALSTDNGKMRLDGDSDNSGNEKITLAANITADIPPAPSASPTVGFNIDLVSGVLLDANVTITGRDVKFRKTIDSATSTFRALTVNSINSGVTSFLGDVGASTRLFTLTTNADGITQIGGNIRTNGTITFNDAVRLTQDAIIDCAGGSGVFFNSTVDTANSAPSARSLTVLTSRGTAAGAVNFPIISFAAKVGNTNALHNLFLNYDGTVMGDGRANVPSVATIVARLRDASGNVIASPSSDISMVFNTTGTFRMGHNEKLTSGGSLTINAPVAAFLGDLNSLGNMRVNSPSITLLRREGGKILGNLGHSGRDDGLDFVSSGTIDFTSSPVSIGSGIEARFGTPTGSGDVNSTLIGFIFQAFGDFSLALINSNGTPLRTLDLESNGPTNTNIANTIAGAIPRESRQGDVGQGISVGQAQFEQIKQLGIVPRNPTAGELVELLTGSATFDDFPRTNPPAAEDYTTVVNRLPSDRMDALLFAYDSVFNKDLLDENGKPVLDEKGKARRVSHTQEIQDALLASVRRFREASKAKGDLDPTAFRAFLEQNETEAVSLGYVRQLGEFLDQLDRIGLTARELTQSKAIILNPVRPRGIKNVQQFEAVIRANTNRAMK